MQEVFTYFSPTTARRIFVLLSLFFTCTFFFASAFPGISSDKNSHNLKIKEHLQEDDSLRIFFSDGLSYQPYALLPLWIYTARDTFSAASGNDGYLHLPSSAKQIMLNTNGGKVKFWYREKYMPGDSFLLVKNERGEEICRLLKGKKIAQELFVLSEIRQPLLLAKREIAVQKKNATEIISGTVYKVQVLTSGKLLSLNDPRFRGEEVAYYADGGIYKYTVGAYQDFHEAARMQESMRKKGFTGAFVVVFRDGIRIK